MNLRSSVAIAIVVPLAGCASDVPENVPERGTWEIVGRIDSMNVDGMGIPPENFPTELTTLAGTEEQCGEPMFIDPEWQQDDLSDRTGGRCTMGNYTHDENGAEGTGTCVVNENGVAFEPRFTARVTFDGQSFRNVVTMEGTTVLPQDGNPHVIRVIAVQEGTRTGDC